MHSTRDDPSPHKIVITGTGRAGTTFLVRLLTALGQPTGYTEENWRRDYFDFSSAGLERDPLDPDAPYIVKNPELSATLPDLLARGELVVDHALVPVRDLEQAALSRVHVGGQAGEIPGGLIGTSVPQQQATVLAERFHRLVHTLVEHDVPHTFLAFPRFVQDVDYAYAKLAPIFSLERSRFDAAFRRLADPTKVHQYVATTPQDPTISARHRELLRAKKRWRRIRRAAQWTAVAATAAIVTTFTLPRVPGAADANLTQRAGQEAPSAGHAPRQSWWLAGSRYRTRNLGYQPFHQPAMLAQPLCLRLDAPTTRLVADRPEGASALR
jgi:hypothetical protein